MHTPTKLALGLLMVFGLTMIPAVPASHENEIQHAHGTILLGSVGASDTMFNACDDADLGSTVAALGFSLTSALFQENSRPATLFRAGDQGMFSTCTAIWPYEQPGIDNPHSVWNETTDNTTTPLDETAFKFTIVANGCSIGALYVCDSVSKRASEIGLYACFYDGTGADLGCVDTYTNSYVPCLYGYSSFAVRGDLVGDIPAGAAYMQVINGLAAGTVSWWMHTENDCSNAF